MSRVGGQIGECLTVAKHDGAPFKPLATRPLNGSICGYADIPQVAAIHITTISLKEHRAFVRRERSLLYLTVSRGKKLTHTSAAGQRIQRLPAVVFGSDDQL